MKSHSYHIIVVVAAVLIAASGLRAAVAQTSIELRLFIDDQTLTVYVPQSGVISLDGFGFQILRDGQSETYRLQDYAAFGLPFSTLPTPACFRLRESGTTNPLPIDCPPALTLTQELTAANVFWYDVVANTRRVVTLTANGIPFGFCPSGIAECTVAYTPSNAAPTQPFYTPTPQPTLDPYTRFTGNNLDWVPIYQTINGIEMVVIPAGCFMMGSNSGAIHERPLSEKCFSRAFYIGLTEVTNEQYALCVEDHACTAPHDDLFFADPDYADYPVVYVDLIQATAFVEWWGGRLPYETEWEYAACGVDNWEYPWGDLLDESLANGAGEDPYPQLAPVGSFPRGASWVGALDMSGNVLEWTGTFLRPYPLAAQNVPDPVTEDTTWAARAMRGGSWEESLGQDLRAAFRSAGTQESWSNAIGFRVARAWDG